MHAEDLLAAFQIGHVHHDLPIEAARPQQRRIEDVRPVGRREQDHAFIRFEPVHLDEQLIERLLALVVPAAQPGAAMAPDGIDFVDEDDTGRVRLALLEQITHARGADADEHLDEIGARHREERPARFARDGLGEQRLAGPRRPHQQGALGQPAAEPLEFLRILEEVDDLLELLLGFVAARDVGERDLGGVTR